MGNLVPVLQGTCVGVGGVLVWGLLGRGTAGWAGNRVKVAVRRGRGTVTGGGGAGERLILDAAVVGV